MYNALIENLSGAPLLVVAIVSYFIGTQTRRNSVYASKYSAVLALAVFALIVFSGMSERDVSLGEFVRIELMHLVLMAISVYGLSSVVLRFGFPLYDSFVVQPQKNLERMRTKREQERQKAEFKKESEKRAAESRRQWEAERPERERREQELQTHQQAAAALATRDAERREQARTKTLLVFHRHAGDLVESFSWERFCEYTDKYMNDSLPADRVEENAEKLLEMISSFYEQEKPIATKKSRSEIHAQFERDRQDVLRCKYSQEETEALLANIAFRERQAILEQT